MENNRIIGLLDRSKKFLLPIFLFLVFHLQAQDPIEYFDSISIKKPNRNKLNFKFKDLLIKTVSIDFEFRVKSKPEMESDTGEPISSDFLQAFFSTSPVSVEVICNPIGKINCDNSDLSWEVPVFCPGVMRTVEDTSARDHALRSFTTMNWKEGAFGFILEKQDTIGDFTIISDPESSPKLGKFRDVAFHPESSLIPDVDEKSLEKARLRIFIDYGIIGNFRGNRFTLLFNGDIGQAWLFTANELCMVFQVDMDDFSYVNRKQKVSPSIKWKTPGTVFDKQDLMRIAMTSRYLSGILTKGYY